MSVAPADFEEDLWTRSVCGCSVPGACCAQLVLARRQIDRLVRANRDQAKTIAELTGAEPGAAPSVACVFYFYAPTEWNRKSWAKKRAKLIPFVDEYGHLPANEVSPAIWDAHRVRRLQTPTRMGRPPCERTLNFSLAEVNAMLKWSARRGMIRRNPLEGARAVKVKSRRETNPTTAEVDQLLLAAEDLRDERLLPEDDDGQVSIKAKALILCMHRSMLRWGEAMRMRWSQIGEAGDVELLGRETKTEQRRMITLTPATLEAIGRINRIPDSPYIFARPETGKPYSYGGFKKWWAKICRWAGADHLVAPGDTRLQPRDLRAGGATAADEAGVRATAIQVAMGHASLSTTSKYLRSEMKASARLVASKMDGEAPARRGPKLAGRRPPKKATGNPGCRTSTSKSRVR